MHIGITAQTNFTSLAASSFSLAYSSNHSRFFGYRLIFTLIGCFFFLWFFYIFFFFVFLLYQTKNNSLKLRLGWWNLDFFRTVLTKVHWSRSIFQSISESYAGDIDFLAKTVSSSCYYNVSLRKYAPFWFLLND